MKKIFLVSIASVVSLAAASAIPAISAGTSSVIKGCVNNKTQVLRVASKCTSAERSISWNAKGEKGAVGPQGSAGPSGPAGAAGSAGSSSNQPRLVVLDANGTIFGYPLDSGTYAPMQNPSASVRDWNWAGLSERVTFFSVFVPSLGKVVKVYQDGTPVSEPIYFASSNCTGTPFTTMIYSSMGSTLYSAHVNGVTSWYRPDQVLYVDAARVTLSNLSREGCKVQRLNVEAFDEVVGVSLVPTSAPYANPAGPLRLTVQ